MVRGKGVGVLVACVLTRWPECLKPATHDAAGTSGPPACMTCSIAAAGESCSGACFQIPPAHAGRLSCALISDICSYFTSRSFARPESESCKAAESVLFAIAPRKRSHRVHAHLQYYTELICN